MSFLLRFISSVKLNDLGMNFNYVTERLIGSKKVLDGFKFKSITKKAGIIDGLKMQVIGVSHFHFTHFLLFYKI